MKKYFQEEEEKTELLSTYVKEKEAIMEAIQKKSPNIDCTNHDFREAKYNVGRAKFLMETLGDVKMSPDLFQIFMEFFYKTGGRYNVRFFPKSISAIYEIKKQYPTLTTRAMEDISFEYIEDLFSKYNLKDALAKFIEKYGETDEAFEEYYKYVDELGAKHHAEVKQLADNLDEYKEEYGKEFVMWNKLFVTKQHYTDIDKLVSCFPMPSLVKQDDEHLLHLSRYYRIHFFTGRPLCNTLIQELATTGNLDDFPEQPVYYINQSGTTEVPAVFTKQEFLDSVEMRKSATLKKVR